MKLSTQAVGAIMMALQKGIAEQTDITQILLSFDLEQSVDGLLVSNPPTFQPLNFVDNDQPEDEEGVLYT